MPEQLTLEGVFEDVYSRRHWPSTHPSGPGSLPSATRQLKTYLTGLIQLHCKGEAVLFAGCGLWSWQHDVYTACPEASSFEAVEIVSDVVKKNREQYVDYESEYDLNFHCADLTENLKDFLPKVNVVICKDVLQHLNNKRAIAVVHNILQLKPKVFITSSDVDPLLPTNESRTWDGIGYVPENLTIEPFNLKVKDKIKLDQKWYYSWEVE